MKRLPLLLVTLAVIVCGAVTLIMPFGRDQGIHAFIADSMLHGKVVYRDVFNVKPPLTTYVHALALLLFGHSMTAIRLLDWLWTLATALLVYAFARRAFRSDWTGAVAGVLYPLLYYQLGYWHTAQTDGWLNLPLAMAFLFVLPAFEAESGGRRAWLRWAGAGLCIGLATLLKYTAALALPLLGLAALVFLRRQMRIALVACAWLVAGFALPLFFAAVVLAGSGAMPAFIESQFRLMPAYTSLSPGHGIFGRLVAMAGKAFGEKDMRLGAVIGTLGLAASPVAFARRRAQRLAFALLLAWLVTAFVSTYAQAKFFIYHYLPFLPVFALLGATALHAGLGPVLARLPKVGRVPAVGVIAVLLVLLAGYPARYRELLSVASGRQALRDYWASGLFDSGTDYSLREDMQLAEYLASTTVPTDRVFIWGLEPSVYFLARRWTVSRFIYNFPLVVSWGTDGFREELVRVFTADPPRVFVLVRGDQMPWVMGHDKDSFATLMELPELRDFVAAHYQPEVRIGRFDVFLLAGR